MPKDPSQSIYILLDELLADVGGLNPGVGMNRKSIDAVVVDAAANVSVDKVSGGLEYLGGLYGLTGGDGGRTDWVPTAEEGRGVNGGDIGGGVLLAGGLTGGGLEAGGCGGEGGLPNGCAS